MQCCAVGWRVERLRVVKAGPRLSCSCETSQLTGRRLQWRLYLSVTATSRAIHRILAIANFHASRRTIDMPFTREQLIADARALLNEGISILKAEVEVPLPRKTIRKKSTTPSGTTSPSTERRPTDGLPYLIAYQSWYTRALPLVRLVLPDRYIEFVEQYKIEKRKDITFLNYTISDYLIGVRITRGGEDVVNPRAAVAAKAQHQLAILRSCADRLGSRLADIQGTVRAELFDDELDAAGELLRKGHVRAAGALAGVTLERHLGAVATTHEIKVAKREPTLADWNDALKRGEVIDTPTWRGIQRLGDLRNLAVHSKGREPDVQDMTELLRGVEKAVKSLF